MDKVTGSLTVFFENPFWVGVFEKKENGMVRAAKHVFGAEPSGNEILDFLKNRYDELEFSPAVADDAAEKRRNPKRAMRDAKKQMLGTGTGTKSQEALKLQHEESRIRSKTLHRKMKEQKEMIRFGIRQQKKKEKHRGK